MYTRFCFLKKVLTVLLFVCIALDVSAQQSDDWYVGKPIKDIVFSGLRHVKASELEGLMEPYKGRMFDDSIFWEIQGKLYALEYFDVITPGAVPVNDAGSVVTEDRATGVTIRFTVRERPVVSRIVFIGNSGLRRNELLDTVSIKSGDAVNQAKIHIDEQAIINKYIEKGYPDIAVKSETQNLGDNTVQLTFTITEGEKITIGELLFEGNNIFSARALRGQLTLKVKGLINDGAFQEVKLVADIAAVTQYYHDRGYIAAEVVDVTREIKKDKKGNNLLTLTFVIYEGIRYTFGGVTFSGNQIFLTEQLSALVRSKVGEVMNARRVASDLQRVADLYYENGYIFNSIEPRENRDTEAGVVSYSITIVERGRAHIENIIVKGNEKTRTEVILREIPLEPGDVFSKAKVYEAWRNLMNLQYFTMVVPETPPGSVDSLMDLVFVVEEQPTTDLQFGMTFAGSADPDTFPISLMFKWNDRNFLGTGNQLGTDVNASLDTFSTSLNYNHRYILGLPLSGGFDFTFQWSKRLAAMNSSAPFFNGDEDYAYPDGFSSRGEYESSGMRPPREFLMNFDQFYFSLGFSTGYRWVTPAGALSLGGGIRTGLVRNTYDNDIYRPFDPALRERNNEWTPKNSFFSTLSLDQRDLYYDPSSGFLLYERYGIYGIIPDEREHYQRSDTRAEYYLTLFDIPTRSEKWNFKAVLALHTALSFIFKQPGRDPDSFTPVVEDANKLAVDGMFTGRGWSGEYGSKGLLMWDNWAEIRIPLVPGILAWDFFFDAVGVETKQGYYFGSYIDDEGKSRSNFTIDNMRFGFGGGLRFTMPQFPFRLSLVKRFKTVDGVFEWQRGQMFATDDPRSGVDGVLSFAISY